MVSSESRGTCLILLINGLPAKHYTQCRKRRKNGRVVGGRREKERIKGKFACVFRNFTDFKVSNIYYWKKDKRKISSPIKYIYLLLIKEVPPSKQLFYYLNTPWYSSGHNNKLLICILSSYIIKAVFWNIIFTSIL